MTNRFPKSILLIFFVCFLCFLSACGDDDVNIATERFAIEAEGVVVMEAENTIYDHTLWALRNASNPGKAGLFHGNNTTDVPFDGTLEGWTGNGYLEYSGDDSFREPTDTSMFYTFQVNNPGTYFMFFRAFENHTYDPDTEDRSLFAEDRNNDCFVRMEGDFDAATDYTRNNSNFGATKEELLNFNKFFCISDDSEPGWGRSFRLEPDEFKEPVYRFKAGEIYKLFVIGRSTQLAIDRIYFARIEDENGETEGDFIYAFNQFRNTVTNGELDESEYAGL
ncbi:MAG: hypothetical protein AAF789_05500 [Bacteroidota bacterium]